MPAGTYTYTLYTISGSANSTFTVTGSFTVTVYDSDDNFGVGDDAPVTETGAAPVIQSLGPGAPAGWNIGDTFYYGGARGLDNDGTDDVYIPKVAGAWQTTTALFSLPGASVPLVVGQTYTRTTASNVPNEVLPCFVSGTRILTSKGEVAVDDLTAGDQVVTMDHGLQTIRWIGSCRRIATGAFAPIRFRKGVMGNTRDLLVSPQHRMLVKGWQAELLFNETEVLVPAKALLSDHGVTRQTGGQVTYFHILFDKHEIIYAHGCPTESFHPGATMFSALDHATQNEVLTLFPALAPHRGSTYGNTARLALRVSEGKVLSQLIRQVTSV